MGDCWQDYCHNIAGAKVLHMSISGLRGRVREGMAKRKARKSQKASQAGDVNARVARARTEANNAEFTKGGSSTF